jgi:RNA polymerase sigma-70 factor (ECF subfamily)
MRYFDRVYAYVRAIFNDDHEAEDATQQVFLKVFEALPEYEHRGRPFRAWLFTIVRNYAISELEKRNRITLMDPAELGRRRDRHAAAEPGYDALEWISDEELLMFVERLPVAQRQVLMLRYLLALDTGEIATVLGRSQQDVRILQHRALRFLEARLTALDQAPERGGSIRMRRGTKQYGVLRARRFALLP